MPQTVHTLSATVINDMKQFYADSSQTPPQGAVFRAKTGDAVITAYRSGKVLFQGSNPEAEAKKWAGETASAGKKSLPARKQAASSYHPPESLFASSHIGTDEAGTGDYFGPITVAGVYVEAEQIHQLKELGVKDSKHLTDARIRSIAKEIVKLELPYSLMVLPNNKYNQLQKKGWSQGKMKAMLHHHVIQKLMKKIDSLPLEGILIDQFCEPAVYKKHIAAEKESLAANTYFMTKAESYSIAVAAGSIIARTSFLKEMDKLSERLEISLPKGASQKVDQTIAKVIREHGRETLDSCAKVHFANSRKAEKYL
ncbi:ribonuclease HIII [Lentibacillus sediminis]|uniref:ribonuclease HIII n=1 Tax=Lentibacillus sediminis TaxID=1940529 RepID=UPI000C1BC2F7|nr:ribonuclease HIII [Lentibacillus sediminis]